MNRMATKEKKRTITWTILGVIIGTLTLLAALAYVTLRWG